MEIKERLNQKNKILIQKHFGQTECQHEPWDFIAIHRPLRPAPGHGVHVPGVVVQHALMDVVVKGVGVHEVPVGGTPGPARGRRRVGCLFNSGKNMRTNESKQRSTVCGVV